MLAELKPLPPLEAIAAFEKRAPNLVETFSWQDAWQEEHATMFTVAKSAGFDILQDIQTAFEKALKEGQTPQQFARQLTPILQQKGWWGKKLVTDPQTGETVAARLGSPSRLQTIFDANMRVSYAAGHWANFERNKKTRPFLRYVTMDDDHVRPQHARRHNLVLPVDHTYWNRWAAPCGWRCRCTMQSLSQREVDQLIVEGEKLHFEPPAETFRSFTNKRTGEIVRVPDGIDPGWAYNPGKAGYEARVNQTIAEKVADASPQMVRAAVEDRVSSSAFERFVRDPQGSMPVMAIPAALRDAVKENVQVAILSAETMEKQLRRHPELTIEDYRALPSIGADPTMVFQDGEQTFVLVKLNDGRWRYAALKVTASRKAAFVTSFRYASDENIARMLNRAGVTLLVDRRGE